MKITNKKAIYALLNADEKMSTLVSEATSIEYDFDCKNIFVKGFANKLIGVYNLLPKRIEDLEKYINNTNI